MDCVSREILLRNEVVKWRRYMQHRCVSTRRSDKLTAYGIFIPIKTMRKHNPTRISLCHISVGRVRIKAPYIRGRKRLSATLKDQLFGQQCFQHVEIRTTTGSIILYFDTNRTCLDEILSTVKHNIAVLPETEELQSKPSRRELPARGVWTKPLVYHFVNAILLGGFLAYALIRKLLFRLPLSQRPFSFTGVVSFMGSLPLFYRSLLGPRKKGMGLYPFLTFATGLAIWTGEALTALEIIWILSVGMFLEEYATERARIAIREILQVAPVRACVIQNGTETEIPVEALTKGDTVVVGFGRKIPVDGFVINGEALVDEAHFTGRAQPEHRRMGDRVYAGTQVQQGAVYIRAEKIGEETYLCHLTNLVEAALSTRTEMEKRADILALRLTRLGVASTILTYILSGSMARCFSVLLVVSCPCATVLAASTAIAAGIANAARRQILIKSGEYLEQMNTIDSACFDKTGTITMASPEIVEILPLNPSEDARHILSLAACAEAASDHPLAKTIREAVRAQDISFAPASETNVVIGRGIRAICNSDTILVGNGDFLISDGIDLSCFQEASTRHLKSGHTVLYVAKNGVPKGMIAATNTIRPEAGEVIEQFKQDGIYRNYLISGDTEPIVKDLAGALGFTDYAAPILPEEKARFIEQLEHDGRRVLMVGDGVNDALALSKATVGVAMGAGGSAVAVEAANIALVNNDLKSLLLLRELSKKTLHTVETNFWIATTTNIAGILLGAAGWLPPVMAGFFHMGHTLGIMLNSGRLLQWEGR
jgi:cation-transporting P-type ATPase C